MSVPCIQPVIAVTIEVCHYSSMTHSGIRNSKFSPCFGLLGTHCFALLNLEVFALPFFRFCMALWWLESY